MFQKLFFTSISLVLVVSLIAQNDYPYPSLSPKGNISQQIGNTLLEIEYERPSARKRKIFGNLVPWDKVWRTGAGHCTKIRFSKSVRIEGQQIEAGTYSLFSIPNPEEWIIILNKDTTLYGSYGYNADNDVIRFIVISEKTSRYYETLNFNIDLVPNNAEIYLSWEHTQIHFEVATSTDDDIETFIKEQLLTGKNKDSNIYAGAAEYYFYQNANLFDAIKLTNKAIELDTNNGWARDLKIRLYEKMKRYDAALKEIELAIEALKKAKFDDEEARKLEIASFEKYNERIKAKMK